MTELVLKLLGAGLDLWVTKEKTKYQDKYIALKKAYYEESNKPDFDDAVLDNIRFDLKLLCNSYLAELGKSNVAGKP